MVALPIQNQPRRKVAAAMEFVSDLGPNHFSNRKERRERRDDE